MNRFVVANPKPTKLPDLLAMTETLTNAQAKQEECVMLQAFFDNVNQYQVLLDEDFYIVSFNKYADHFTETYQQLQLQKGKCIFDFVSAGFATDFRALCNSALTIGVITFEHFISISNGVKIWFDFTINPIYKDNRVIGLMIVGNNVNAQKNNEKILRTQSQSLSTIAQLQSHQVRQPVSSILGLLSLIKEDNYNVKKEYLKGLETATEQLDNVIKAIVNQSRVS